MIIQRQKQSLTSLLIADKRKQDFFYAQKYKSKNKIDTFVNTIKKMADIEKYKTEINENGFATLEPIYTDQEIEQILVAIDQADQNKTTRQFFKEIPATINYVLNDRLKKLISQLFGNDYFVVKSIYFDKPPHSNWYAAYHQDLTISVDKKVTLENYGALRVIPKSRLKKIYRPETIDWNAETETICNVKKD